MSAREHIPGDRRDLFGEIDGQVSAYAEAMAGGVLEPPGDR